MTHECIRIEQKSALIVNKCARKSLVKLARSMRDCEGTDGWVSNVLESGRDSPEDGQVGLAQPAAASARQCNRCPASERVADSPSCWSSLLSVPLRSRCPTTHVRRRYVRRRIWNCAMQQMYSPNSNKKPKFPGFWNKFQSNKLNNVEFLKKIQLSEN